MTATRQPAYPTRKTAKSTLRKTLRRTAVAIGTSALLGLSACGAADQHTEEIPLPGVMPAPELPTEVETDDPDTDEQLPPAVEEEPVHIRGGIRPVQVPAPPPDDDSEKPDEQQQPPPADQQQTQAESAPEEAEQMSREQALQLLRALDHDEQQLKRSVQQRLQEPRNKSGKRW